MNADPIVAAIAAGSAAGRGFSEILESAIRSLHDSNPRFHWTGIYELTGGVLELGPYVGAPTDHGIIPVGRGVCGTAVAEGRNQNIPDVSALENYLACSVDTRSELVILIRTGERIHGQIDIDSHEPAAFDVDTEREVQKVADALARLYDARG